MLYYYIGTMSATRDVTFTGRLTPTVMTRASITIYHIFSILYSITVRNRAKNHWIQCLRDRRAPSVAVARVKVYVASYIQRARSLTHIEGSAALHSSH